MSRRMYLVPLFVATLVCAVPDSTRAQQGKAGPPSAGAADLDRAKQIYGRDCLVCHGANGDGKTDILRDRDLNLPDWTDSKSLDQRADQQLFNAIRFGKGKMPAERVGRADDGEVRGLVHYIRTMAKNEAKVIPEAGAVGAKK